MIGYWRTLAICIALALAACTVPTASSPTAGGSPLAQVSAFTMTDLQNADAIAVAKSDALGHACYPALEQFIGSLPAGTTMSTTVSGAISAFETARVTRLGAQSAIAGGLPDYLKLGCSPLVLDEQTLLLKLAALGAGGAVAAPLLPALGAALPVLP